MRTLIGITALVGLSVMGTAQAGDDADFAESSLIIGVSPFGGSLSYSYAFSSRTNVQATFGGIPETSFLSTTVDGTDYDLTSKASWAGGFISHRPVENADWFRMNMGLAVGSIENTLEDSSGDRYDVNFKESPSAYMGIGFGLRPNKGLQYGLDMGALFGAGAQVIADPENTGDAAEAIASSPIAGNVLPNAQLTIGWGF